MTRGVIRIVIQSLHNEFTRELTCLTIPVISDLVPAEVFPRNSIDIPDKIVLADPQFFYPRSVEILIGAGATLSLFTGGQINLSRANGDLYLQKTRLGWIVAGGNAVSYQPRNALCSLTDLEQQIARFLTSEEVQGDTSKSIEKNDCEMHFLTHVTRNNDGRYVVRLPFRNDGKRLGESRTIALKRLYSLERKLDSDPTLKLAYTKIIQEYLDLNQTSPIEDPADDGFYMPHHAVIKAASSTTRVRIVFDASAKTDNGTSLNANSGSYHTGYLVRTPTSISNI